MLAIGATLAANGRPNAAERLEGAPAPAGVVAQSPALKQSAVIPGYAGYVPRVKVNNQFLGKRVTEQSRQVFKEDVLDRAVNNFSTTG